MNENLKKQEHQFKAQCKVQYSEYTSHDSEFYVEM